MKKYAWFGLAFVVLLLLASACSSREDSRELDILIRNGRILDGTGNPWFYADLGIRGDEIAAVGDLSDRKAGRVIDARGKTVCPGFIDMHTHCDGGLGDPDTRANLNYLSQGVTTVVTGNCGYGPLNVAETAAAWRDGGIGTNAVLLAGFGTVRRAVLGDENRAPTMDELERMKSLLEQAMREGAWGLSTGLQYIPDRYAATEEIIALTGVVAAHGGIYSSHMRSEEEKLVEAVAETIRIGEETGARINTSHLKASGKLNWGLMKPALELIKQARARGIEMTADMYPYDKSSTTTLQTVFNLPPDMEPFAGLEKKIRDSDLPAAERAALAGTYVDELAAALSDPARREKIRALTEQGDPDKVNWVAKGGWYNFTIVDSKKHPEWIGRMFCDLAAEQKRPEFDIAADLFAEERNGLVISLSTMSEEDVRLAMRQEFVMISSDGSAVEFGRGNVHPRNYGSNIRVLRKYVREEGLLTLAEAVRKMTSLPARLLRLERRGLLLEGYAADVVIFDPETVRDNATFLEPHQYSTGVETVLLNGQPVIEDGRWNSALNGRVLLLTENR